jgi:hypothetical protein
MRHTISKAAEADMVSREHLVRLLMEQIERTSTLEGRNKAMQQIAEMFRSLEEPVLRGLVYRQGLQDEDELTEPGPEERPTP